MQVLMRGKRVGVEKLGRASNQKTLLSMPEDTSAVGTIRYVGDSVTASDLKVGTKVFFGKNRHELQMNGVNILVMDEENVYAIVAEDTGAEDKQKASS